MGKLMIVFGFGGRIGRKRFWILFGASTAAMVVCALPLRWAYQLPSWGVGIASAGMVIAAWVQVAAMVRRLQDRDKPWWFLALYCVAPIILLRSADPALWWPGLALALIAAGELGIFPGTGGVNRFGREPTWRRPINDASVWAAVTADFGAMEERR